MILETDDSRPILDTAHIPLRHLDCSIVQSRIKVLAPHQQVRRGRTAPSRDVEERREIVRQRAGTATRKDLEDLCLLAFMRFTARQGRMCNPVFTVGDLTANINMPKINL